MHARDFREHVGAVRADRAGGKRVEGVVATRAEPKWAAGGAFAAGRARETGVTRELGEFLEGLSLFETAVALHREEEGDHTREDGLVDDRPEHQSRRCR